MVRCPEMSASARGWRVLRSSAGNKGPDSFNPPLALLLLFRIGHVVHRHESRADRFGAGPRPDFGGRSPPGRDPRGGLRRGANADDVRGVPSRSHPRPSRPLAGADLLVPRGPRLLARRSRPDRAAGTAAGARSAGPGAGTGAYRSGIRLVGHSTARAADGAADGLAHGSRLDLRALAATERKAEALKHYKDLVTLLKRELNAEPDAATRSLADELRTVQPPSVAKIPEPRQDIDQDAKREDAAFSLPAFHDRLLSLGSLPLSALRRELARPA